MKRVLFSISFVLFSLVSLLGQQPAWINSLPADPRYYTGIGSCEKTEPDFRAIATKNALALIAEQIQVSISVSNELYSQDHNLNFNQEYFQTVKTSSMLTIQDHELIDSWEDEEVFFVYYRLSRETYRANLLRDYDMAISAADSLIQNAKTATRDRYIHEAVFNLLEASRRLEPVVVNSFIREKYEEVVNRWNLIQSELLRLLFEFRIEPLEEKIQVKESRTMDVPISIKAHYTGEDTPLPLEQVPVVYSLSGNLNAFENRLVRTGQAGIASNRITHLYNPLKVYSISCKIDFSAYLTSMGEYAILKGPEFSGLMSSCQVLLEMIPVSVLVQTSEMTYSRKNSAHVLDRELEHYLAGRNYAIVDHDRKADFVIDLRSDTRRGNSFEGMCTAYLDIEYTVTAMPADSLVSTGIMEPVKGISLNYETAAAQAYRNAAEAIRTGLGKELVKIMK